MLAQEVASKYDLKAFLASDSTLLTFLKAPEVLEEWKLALVRNVFRERIEKLFIEFLIVLVEKHRIAFLPEVIDEFTRLVEAEKGIGRATVITAAPLNETEKVTSLLN